MVGKARVDLPRARLRGNCRVIFMPPGSLRIDFRHASLFGAWREDATIVVLGDSLAIVDRERGTILAGDDAIDLVAGHLEAPFSAGDLVVAFLFRAIGSGDLDVNGARGNLTVRSVGSGDVDHRNVDGRIALPKKR